MVGRGLGKPAHRQQVLREREREGTETYARSQEFFFASKPGLIVDTLLVDDTFGGF